LEAGIPKSWNDAEVYETKRAIARYAVECSIFRRSTTVQIL
jgi:hypothetical protein